jgi:hypothetical protein
MDMEPVSLLELNAISTLVANYLLCIESFTPDAIFNCEDQDLRPAQPSRGALAECVGDYASFPSVIAANLALEQPAQTAPPETCFRLSSQGASPEQLAPEYGNQVEGGGNGQDPESHPCRSDSS